MIVDVARAHAIADYGVLDASAAGDLEGVVRLAAGICGVPTAVINIISERFQHQIAAVGFDAAVCAREDSMCAAVFAGGEQVAVADARLDPRFAANPFVTGEIGSVRFYVSHPLRTPDGVLIGTLCVFDEETGALQDAQSRALALLAAQVIEILELRRATRELARSNEQLARFAGQVSHDLRNPLTALSGFLELVAESPEIRDAPDIASMLERARSAADRMSSLVVDLLAYARVGGARPRSEPVDLARITAEAIEDLGAEIARTHAVVTTEITTDVVGDATLLRELVQNLVANAIKFAAAVRPDPRVAFRAVASDGSLHLTVGDNGPGVPTESREGAFGLLVRADPEVVPGLGIGLSTCRRIVQAHGGRIGIDDSPLGGARLWLVLPEAVPTAAADR